MVYKIGQHKSNIQDFCRFVDSLTGNLSLLIKTIIDFSRTKLLNKVSRQKV